MASVQGCSAAPSPGPLRKPPVPRCPPARTVLAAGDGAEGAEAIAGQEARERRREGVGTDARGLLDAHLTRGLSTPGLADLSALRARVRVAAAREAAREPLLRRHHLEPAPCHGDSDGTQEHGHGDGDMEEWRWGWMMGGREGWSRGEMTTRMETGMDMGMETWRDGDKDEEDNGDGDGDRKGNAEGWRYGGVKTWRDRDVRDIGMETGEGDVDGDKDEWRQGWR